jgi:hypothetical protein
MRGEIEDEVGRQRVGSNHPGAGGGIAKSWYVTPTALANNYLRSILEVARTVGEEYLKSRN